MTGRTTWWAKDAAWHRRELQVELGDEFGAAGPHVLDVLCSWAQEQRGLHGAVRGGFRALAREAFVTVGHAESIVARAAEIGALDDLQIDDDGRRFSARVSGWSDDQARGRAAWRKARSRGATEENELDADERPDRSASPVAGHVTQRDGASHDVTRSAQPDQVTEERGERASAAVEKSDDALHPQLADVLEVLNSAPGLVVEDYAVHLAMLSRPARDALPAARLVAAWAHEGGLRITSASRLLFSAFERLESGEARRDGVKEAASQRELARGGRATERDERRARGVAALESLMNTEGGAS